MFSFRKFSEVPDFFRREALELQQALKTERLWARTLFSWDCGNSDPAKREKLCPAAWVAGRTKLS